MIAALLRSGVLRTSAVFGAGALAFAGANLLFARQLTAEAYGTLALVVALVALGSPIAPFGLDAIVVRHRIRAEPRLVLRCAATSMLLAGVMAGVGAIIYGLATAELAVIAAAVLGGGCVRLAAAKLQSEEQFVASTLTVESMNFLLLVAAAMALLLGLTDASGPLRLVAILPAWARRPHLGPAIGY